MARTTVYNDIVQDKYNLVCDENKDLLVEFIEYLQSTDKSPDTIISYTSDIKILFVWNMEFNKNKHFTELNKRDYMRYQNYLINTLNLSPNRVRRLRSSASSLSNYVENMLDDIYPDFRAGLINKIPAPAKEVVREKTILSDEQVQEVLDDLVKNKHYQRALALALAWASGSRKSELLRFKVSYFKDEYIVYGSLYKTPEKIKTKGRGSRGKLLNRYSLVNKVKPYFDLWMEERQRLGISEDIDELFLIKKNKEWKPMQVTTLNSWASVFSKMFNVDFYFHCLRHNFTTGLSTAGVPANVIKELVGWNDVNMVHIYDDNDIDDKLGDYFDENGIKEVKKKSLNDL